MVNEQLQHAGVRGMKWGIRRYQYKDGSLTPAGRKHYNQEVSRLKAKTQKVKEKEKVASNKAKTQAKFDKLEEKKQKLKEREDALKNKNKEAKKQAKDVKEAEKAKKSEEEKAAEIAKRREKVLKSVDAKELYENKDILTDAEINERINRIDLERRLQSKIPVEQKKTAMERLDNTLKTYKKASELYDAVSNSKLGKKLAKSLGIDTGDKKKRQTLDEFLADLENKSDKDIISRKTAEDALNKLKGMQKGDQSSDSTSKPKGSNGSTSKGVGSMVDDAASGWTFKKTKTERVHVTADDIIEPEPFSSKFKSYSKKSDVVDGYGYEKYVYDTVEYPISTQVRSQGRNWLESNESWLLPYKD